MSLVYQYSSTPVTTPLMIDNDVDSVATNKPYILTGNRKEPGIKRTPNKPHGNKIAIPVATLTVLL